MDRFSLGSLSDMYNRRFFEIYRPGLKARTCDFCQLESCNIEITMGTYIMLSYSHDLIFRYPSAANTLNVGNGHVAHHLSGNVTHCAISMKRLARCTMLI